MKYSSRSVRRPPVPHPSPSPENEALAPNEASATRRGAVEYGTVDDELKRLKGEMHREALPAGRPVADALASSVERQLEMLPIEDDLERLKQRVINQKKITGL